MELRKQAKGMWLTRDGKDCSDLPGFNWQETGFHMQQTIADLIRGVDDDNDEGYLPETSAVVERVLHEDPFHDEDVDPDMMKMRSTNVLQHLGPFWTKTGGAQADTVLETISGPVIQSGKEKTVKPWIQISGKTVTRWILILASCFLLFVIMRYVVFDVRSVSVVGNKTIETSRILQMAGIRRGDNFLTIQEKQVEANINSLHYLQYEAMERRGTHDIILHIRERERASYILHCGIIFILDSRGMVLDECAQEDVVPDYPEVKGLDIKRCVVGREIILNNPEQLSIFRQFELELKVMSLSDLVREIYLSDTSNIYLGTSNGYSVRMGNAEQIHGKLRVLTMVLEKLKENEQPVGTIDVSDPYNPTFIPTSSL